LSSIFWKVIKVLKLQSAAGFDIDLDANLADN